MAHPFFCARSAISAQSALIAAGLTLLAAQPAWSLDVLGARGPGGYLSPLKLGLVAIVFFVWVKLADWMNRDAVQIGELTGQIPQLWNPINVGLHLAGFFAAISIPIFWVGWPIYVTVSLLPFIIYRFIRRSRMKKDTAIKQRLTGEEDLEMGVLAQDTGVEFDFTAAGSDSTDKQANLIRARQADGYVPMKDLLADCMSKRAETLLIDYTQSAAAPRILVDGSWHALEPMDRVTGDGVLTSLKFLAGTNPADRRNQQNGRFKTKSDFGKIEIDVTSVGVQGGERVQLKFIGAEADKLSLKKLGMLPGLQKAFIPALNKPGICIVSAPPGQGLTTSWQGLLLSADRMTRDCIGLVHDGNEEETALENIVIKKYNASAQGDQGKVLAAALLTRPDSLAVPHIGSPEVTDQITEAIQRQEISVWLQTSAHAAVEALLRVMANSKDRVQFVDTVRYVTCQRLARRLCPHCRQEIRVQPQLIQQLGGDPRKQQTIYQAWRLPPPEQRVDENGREIEFPTCQTCGGLGHIGRIAIYEMLTVNDQVRKTLKESPKAAAVDAAARKSGAKIAMSASAWKLVLLGVISLQEAQQALKQNQPPAKK